MERKYLQDFAEIVRIRKNEISDKQATTIEKEYTKLFLWFISQMLNYVENIYPPINKYIKAYKVKEYKGGIYIYEKDSSSNSCFCFDPTIKDAECLKILLEVLDYINNDVDGYSIHFLSPHEKNVIKEFMIKLQ